MGAGYLHVKCSGEGFVLLQRGHSSGEDKTLGYFATEDQAREAAHRLLRGQEISEAP